MGKILIVDDDASIAELIGDALCDEGFEVVIKTDPFEAREYIESAADEISLMTLDIMMPKLSGIDLCKEFRNILSCPIIFVSAKGKSLDAMEGLDAGGDDYITKPFVVEEFVARVKAHIRREERRNNEFSPSDGKHIKVGDIEIFTDCYEAYKGSKQISFSTREFQLLQYLMENAGVVLTREQIFNHVWGSQFGDIGTVAVNIKSIRDKIDPDNNYIKTIWGVGYKFVKVSK